MNPADVHGDVAGDAGVDERLLDREVGVVQLDVLADDGDIDAARRALEPLDHGAPFGQVAPGGVDLHEFDDGVAQACLFKGDGHLVDAGHGR